MAEVLIKYEDVPYGAADSTVATCSDLQVFSSLPSMLSAANEAPRSATFEDDYWTLGDKMHLFSDDSSSQNYGLFSTQQSKADKTFATPITLELELISLFSSTALSFEFDPVGPTWCSDMDVKWYHDDTLIYSGKYMPASWQYTLEQPVENFNKIIIVFNSMSAPYRYLKVQSIAYGPTRRFTSKEIKSLRYTPEVDAICDVMPVNYIEFELKSSDVALIFQRKQRLELYDGNEFLGVFFIESSTQKRSGLYDVKACDFLGLLDMASKYTGSIFNGVPASTAVSAILGNIPYEIDSTLSAVSVNGWLPIAGRRESLHQLAFSIGAIVLTHGRRRIAIVSLPNSLASEIGNNRVYENGEIEQGTFVTSVEVKARNYNLGTKSVEIYSERLTGTVRIEFSEPHGGISVTGGTLVASSSNHAVISGTGGVVKLSGLPYNVAESVYSKENPDRNASDADYVISYNDMTLVTPSNVNAVLNRCYEIRKRTRKVKIKALIKTEKVGDFVGIWCDGQLLYGNIVSMDYSISSKTAADIEVLIDEEYEVINDHS